MNQLTRVNVRENLNFILNKTKYTKLIIIINQTSLRSVYIIMINYS